VVGVVFVDVDVGVELVEVDAVDDVSVSDGSVVSPVSSPLSPPHAHNRLTNHQARILDPSMTGQVTGPPNPPEPVRG